MISRTNGWTKWLLGLFAACVVAVAGWGGSTIIATSTRVTRVETQHEDWKGRLERIETKVDMLLQRGR